MGRRPDFEPVETKSGWMVSIPPGMSATGKRVRKFFPDLQKAQKFAGTTRAAHTAGLRGLLTTELAAQAVVALRILQPLGISLPEAARMVAATQKASEKTEVFKARWRRALLDGEKRWRQRYIDDMGKIPRWLGRTAMGMQCGELSDEAIERALRMHGARSLSTLAARKSRVMAVLNFRERAPKKTTAIQILSPGQCARVLRVCHGRDELRVVALLLFAGIRPDAESGEISRLDWEAVGEREIYVSPEVSKVGDRHVEIQPRLRRLLRGHPAEGPVIPAGWRRAWQRIRREAGISEMQDVLRHTFASNWLAAFGEDAAKLAMGHTKGSDTLFRHYRRAVTQEAGKRFFR